MVDKPGAECCARCGSVRGEVRIEKCPICFTWICRACATRRHGKSFCSAHCAASFFFGEEESEE